MRKLFLIVVCLSSVVVMAFAAVTSFPAPGGSPTGLAYNGISDELYFYDAAGFRPIFRLDPSNGAFLGSFPSGGAIGGIEFDGIDHLFVTDFFNPGDPARVREIAINEADGVPHTIFNEFSVPFRAKGIAFDGTNLYLADWDSPTVLVTDRTGSGVTQFNTGLRTTDMVFDPTTGNIWALHLFDANISEITTNGTRLRTCGTPRDPGNFGFGGVTLVGSYLLNIAENNPDGLGQIFVVDPATLICDALSVATFLLIDEDGISGDLPPTFIPNAGVNDDIAEIGIRTPLSFFAANIGATITLHSGEVGDEGWFAPTSLPGSWDSAGPTADGVRNFVGNPSLAFPHSVGPGLGTPDANGDREALLDMIDDVTPLRATGLKMLEGRVVCAVVYDSDFHTNYGPLQGNLKGANLGTVAFRVLSVTALTGFSSSSLPKVEIRILDASAICESELTLFTDAPEPESSSEPFDVTP